MTEMRLKKPCKPCPWRRDSAPGWLGASTPEGFVQAQEVHDMPCHMTVDYEQPHWEETLDDAAACVGGLQFLANSCTLPYDPELKRRRDEAGKNPEVFNWGHEFVQHHRKLGLGSWDLSPEGCTDDE